MKRRTLLKCLGGLGLAAPFVGSLLSREVLADNHDAPLRFVLLFTGNGQLPEHWLPPSGGESDFTLSPVLEPLAAVRERLLLLRGFASGSSHSVGVSESLTGRPSTSGDGIATGGPSIDQFFADRWHGEAPLHSLDLGVIPANESHDQICYSAGGLPIPAMGQSLGAFERVFAVTNEDPAVALARRAQKGSVLDVIASDLTVLQSRIGPSSRRLLDEHLTLIREQEKDLQRPFEPTQCPLHEAPSSGGLEDTWNAHNQTIVAALRCDATRVATIKVGGWGGIESGGYDEIGIAAGHHDAAHGGGTDPNADLLGINRFHAERLANLVTALDAVPEGDGTLLDNTVVVWLNEFGLGPFNHHSRADVPVVLAGGANAGMANGRYREVDGMDYHHFLYSLTHLLGATETTSFGDRGDQLVMQLFA